MLTFTVFYTVVFLTQIAQSQLQEITLDPDWTTDPSQFYRRAWHSSIHLDRYIYVDGGEVYWQENGTTFVTPYNSTYSLPLGESWAPATAHFTRIDKGNATVFNRPNLWPDTNNAAFFSFNGELSQALAYESTGYDPPDPAQLWRFVPDGAGSGKWQLFNVAPSTVTQSCSGAMTYAKDSVYILGGVQDWRSSLKMYGDGQYINTELASADGLLTYNMENRDWVNQTMRPFAPTGWSYEGQLQHLTGFGDGNLLLAMGGMTALPLGFRSGETAVPYDTVSIYNTATNDWRNQSTTGDIPDGRSIGSCYVGVAGDNGTFEIFLHGGRIGASSSVQSQINIDLDQVHVLSIPSFSWHKTSYTPTDARALHTCHVAGKKQMIAIGGIPPDLSLEYIEKDPWPQGIGIFDLSEMKWKDSYDPDAAPYETPTQVKEFIAKNGAYPQWNDDVIELWITGRVSSNGSSSASPAASDEGGKGGSGSNTEAIVGGVVGGVGGALLLALLGWFLLRRRNKTKRDAGKSKKKGEEQGYDKPELDGKYGVTPNEPWLSTNGKDGPELYGQPMHEMEGTHAEYELPAEKKQRYEMPGR